MTAVWGPEEAQSTSGEAGECPLRRRRLLPAAGALLLTVLLALLADRLSCRCGAGMNGMQWLKGAPFRLGLTRHCPDTPNIIL